MTRESSERTTHPLLSKLWGRLRGAGTSRTVLKASVAALLVKSAGLGISFVLTVLLTRGLGVDGFGAYSLAISWVLLFAVPVQSGLVGVVVRDVAGYKAIGDWSSVKGLLIFSNIGCLLVSVISAILFWLYWMQVGEAGSGLSGEVVVWIAVLVPVYCLSSLRSAVLRGFGRVTAGLAPEQVLRPALQLVVMFVLFSTLGATLGSEIALRAHFVASAATFVVGAILLYRVTPPEIGAVLATYHPNKWIKPILAFALVSGFGSIMQSLITIILGVHTSTQEVALLKTSQQLAMISGLVVLAVNSAAAPHVATLLRLGQKEELAKVLRRFAKIMFLGTLMPGVVLMVWNTEVLQLLFGSEYGAGGMALLVLVGGQTLLSTLGLVGLTLNMAGFERDTLTCCVVAMLAAVLAALTLTEAFGAVGAAISIVLGQFIMQVMLLSRLRARLGISSFIL